MVLEKDKPKTLENGDVIGLLADHFHFKVVYKASDRYAALTFLLMLPALSFLVPESRDVRMVKIGRILNNAKYK